MKRISVFIVDDNKSIRQSMSLLLNATEGFKCAGAVESFDGLSNMILQLGCDVILMDIDMPAMNGIDAVKALRSAGIETPILMLTGFEDDEKVFDSICAGANGYLLKNTVPKDLLAHISEVTKGGAPMSPSIARKVLTMFKDTNAPQRPMEEYNLSIREKEVLELLVQGHSYKMIAADLGISYETVHSHIKKIYKTLHVNSSTEAVAKSLKNNIV